MTNKIRSRKTKRDIEDVKQAIKTVLAAEKPMSVRQLYYQLVCLNVIAKTQTEYKMTVIRLLAEMRRSGDIPFDWIADGTRWMRKPLTYNSLSDALWDTAQSYRRSLWRDANSYCEIWLEKEALAGVVVDVTDLWDVPLMVCRGYPSISFLHSAAEAIDAQCKPTSIYYLGDHDPSGRNIPRFVESEIREYAPDVDLDFRVVAVTEEQISRWNLPTRPTKTSDSRSKNFDGESVEVDAIPANELRRLTQECIEKHLDSREVARIKQVERLEKQTLKSFALQQSYPGHPVE